MIGLDDAALDITSPGRAVAEHRREAVVNRAAHTAVDDAGTGRGRPLATSAEGSRVPARAVADQRARLLHGSPDDAVSGEARTTPGPVFRESAPGTACARTGPVWPHGLVRTVTDLEARRDTVDVVDDPRGQSARSKGVAERVVGPRPRLGRDTSGVFRATGSVGTTWYEPAREVLRLPGAGPDRIPPSAARSLSGPRSDPPPAPQRTAAGSTSAGRRCVTGVPPCTKPFLGSARSPLRETP